MQTRWAGPLWDCGSRQFLFFFPLCLCFLVSEAAETQLESRGDLAETPRSTAFACAFLELFHGPPASLALFPHGQMLHNQVHNEFSIILISV